MIDISTVGATVSFSGGLSTVITEFSDEGTPFEASDVDVSTNAKNLNGTMISSRTPSVYPFSVTVIPGSSNDDALTAFFRKSLLQPGVKAGGTDSLKCNCVITIPGIDGAGTRSYTYTNCRAKSGPIGPSSSAEGRQSARTFSFEAESVS